MPWTLGPFLLGKAGKEPTWKGDDKAAAGVCVLRVHRDWPLYSSVCACVLGRRVLLILFGDSHLFIWGSLLFIHSNLSLWKMQGEVRIWHTPTPHIYHPPLLLWSHLAPGTSSIWLGYRDP